MRLEIRNEPKEDPVLGVHGPRGDHVRARPDVTPTDQERHVSMRKSRLTPAITHRPCQTRIVTSSFESDSSKIVDMVVAG
jgi:hypothetical protein